MVTRVSVVLPSFVAQERTVIPSLDRQSLPTAAFEVLVMNDGVTDDVAEQIADLVAHRVNVKTSKQPDLISAAKAASGEYVLFLDGDRRLQPTALERLLVLADATQADVVIGVTGEPGRRPKTVLGGANRSPDLLAEDDLDRLGPNGRLLRRTLLATGGADTTVTEIERATTAAASTVAALESMVCFTDGAGSASTVPPDAQAAATAELTSLVWSQGVLRLTVTAPVSTTFSLYAPEFGVAWAVEADTEDDGNFALSIDPLIQASGEPLPATVWWVTSHTDGVASTIATDPRIANRASVADRVHVTFASHRRLGLDVGGNRLQPVRRLPAHEAVVTETARGSRLVVPVPTVDIASDRPVHGQIRLGGLPVDAVLTRDDRGGAVLEAWVSGLPGRRNLSTKFSSAGWARTGTLLVIDGMGGMRLRRVRKKSPAAPGAGAKRQVAASSAVLNTTRQEMGKFKRRVRERVNALLHSR